MSSITLNDNQRKMIEELAGTGFTIAEIAEVLQVDKKAFLSAFNDEDSEVHRLFRKGFLQAEFKLRKRIFIDAGHGSSPAQSLAKRILDDCSYSLKQKIDSDE